MTNPHLVLRPSDDPQAVLGSVDTLALRLVEIEHQGDRKRSVRN